MKALRLLAAVFGLVVVMACAERHTPRPHTILGPTPEPVCPVDTCYPERTPRAPR